MSDLFYGKAMRVQGKYELNCTGKANIVFFFFCVKFNEKFPCQERNFLVEYIVWFVVVFLCL